MFKITSLTKSCEACPSQWEGTTEDGKEIYIRYRWGRLTLYIGGTLIVNKLIGGKLDGYLTDEQMLKELDCISYDGIILPS